jgi:hypothetical protein
MATSHIDFTWQTPESSDDVLFSLEQALLQAIPHIGGMNVNPAWEAKYSHQKMRVTLTVEIIEDFK